MTLVWKVATISTIKVLSEQLIVSKKLYRPNYSSIELVLSYFRGVLELSQTFLVNPIFAKIWSPISSYVQFFRGWLQKDKKPHTHPTFYGFWQISPTQRSYYNPLQLGTEE